MTFGISGTALLTAGITAGGAYLASKAQTNAGNQAADAISGSAQQGIDGITSAQNAFNQSLSPFINTGTSANAKLGDLLGLNGANQQQTMIDALRSSPAYTSALKSGETSILANASATGGLRGGNTQAALAQFSPQLLSQLINQQYSQLSGVSNQGLSALGQQGSSNLGSASAIAQLLGQQGSAQAGAALNSGKSTGGLIGGIASALGGLF